KQEVRSQPLVAVLLEHGRPPGRQRRRKRSDGLGHSQIMLPGRRSFQATSHGSRRASRLREEPPPDPAYWDFLGLGSAELEGLANEGSDRGLFSVGRRAQAEEAAVLSAALEQARAVVELSASVEPDRGVCREGADADDVGAAGG